MTRENRAVIFNHSTYTELLTWDVLKLHLYNFWNFFSLKCCTRGRCHMFGNQNKTLATLQFPSTKYEELRATSQLLSPRFQ